MDQGSNQQPQNESIIKAYKDKLANFIPKNNQTENNMNDNTNNLLNLTKPNINKNNTIPNNNINSKNTLKANIENQTISQNPKVFEKTVLQKQTNYTSTTNISKEHKADSQHKNKLEPHARGIISLVIKSVIIILLTFCIGYFVVNYQALILKLDYWYQTSIKHQKWSKLHPIELMKAQETVQKLDENYLYIPTVGIQAPVSWGVEETDIKNLLNNGLVQYDTSNLPDDAVGNIYIMGNTSGPIWNGSSYKTIFTLLDKVANDQVITIIYNNKIYLYKIFEISFKKNKDVVITPGNDDESILNLLAQYPVGLNWKTLIVKAKLYKIESNIVESVGDKIEKLDEIYNENQLGPIKVDPTPTVTPTPVNNNIPNPELLPQHFLPKV